MTFLRKLFVTVRDVANHPTNRDRRWQAALRFPVVQMAARVFPGDVCVPYPNEALLLVPPQFKGAAHFIDPGLCEFDTMSFVVHFLKPGELFVDVGAFIGAYTVLASGVAQAKTLALEPNPLAFDYLVHNIRLNGMEDRASALNLAVGQQEGAVRMTQGLGTENFVAPPDSRVQTVEVQMNTLDAVLRAAEPMLMKIDVEGFETPALSGGQQVTARSSLSALIIERAGMGARYGFDETQLHERLRAAGFAPCAYLPIERKLTRLPPEAPGNIIYLRDVQAAQARLTKALPFRYKGRSF